MRYPFNLNKTHWLIAIGLIISSPFAHAAVTVVIKTYGQHVGGNIVYTHQVTNNGACNIVGFTIAEDTDMVDVDIPYTKALGELSNVMPLGSAEYYASGDVLTLPGDVLPSSVSGLPGWTAQIIQIEDSGLYMQWDSAPSPQPKIQPGQTANFSVTVPKIDASYLTGHFSADFGVGCPWKYNGVMQKLDVAPPVLSVSLTPSSLPLAQRGQIVPITATINMSDNYDLAPDIQLVSITANETMAATDVQGATINTDDRSFSLKAAHTTSIAARIYTVKYSATDASGNKSTATATVTAY